MANPEISQKTDKTRRKSLGMRLSTSAQFTGQIDRVRQNETLASVRHPQPPIYDCFRPPDSAKGGHSLTDTIGSGSVNPVRVRYSQSADSDDHIMSSDDLATRSLIKSIFQYKDISLKQASAAHHEKILSVHMNSGKPPLGISRSCFETLIDKIEVPFKNDPLYLQEMQTLTKDFSLKVTQSLSKLWRLRKDDLRDTSRALKDEIYKNSKAMNAHKRAGIMHKLEQIEKQIGSHKQELAKTRLHKTHKIEKRKHEMNDPISPTKKSRHHNETHPFVYPHQENTHNECINTVTITTADYKNLCTAKNDGQWATPVYKKNELLHKQSPVNKVGFTRVQDLLNKGHLLITDPTFTRPSPQKLNYGISESAMGTSETWSHKHKDTLTTPQKSQDFLSLTSALNATPGFNYQSEFDKSLNTSSLSPMKQEWDDEMDSILLTCDVHEDESRHEIEIPIVPTTHIDHKATHPINQTCVGKQKGDHNELQTLKSHTPNVEASINENKLTNPTGSQETGITTDTELLSCSPVQNMCIMPEGTQTIENTTSNYQEYDHRQTAHADGNIGRPETPHSHAQENSKAGIKPQHTKNKNNSPDTDKTGTSKIDVISPHTEWNLTEGKHLEYISNTQIREIFQKVMRGEKTKKEK